MRSAVILAVPHGNTVFQTAITIIQMLKLSILTLLLAASSAAASTIDIKPLSPYKTLPPVSPDSIEGILEEMPQTLDTATFVLAIDRPDFDSIISVPSRAYTLVPPTVYAPAVFDTYHFYDPLTFTVSGPVMEFPTVYQWLDDLDFSVGLNQRVRQNYMIANAPDVVYNLAWLPEPPKQYTAFVDPTSAKIVLKEIDVKPKEIADGLDPEIGQKKWIQSFDASLQFSQAYVSPNWYQGGNKNLNLLANLIYKVSLNQKFYPKYLFEAVAQYKLGINNAPDDTVRSVHINEDLFQVNVTAGMKAAKNWYYSANRMFKTQVFDHYPTNSRQIQSALMSPGELNIGLGMTYNRTSANKRFSLNASLSPATYNLKTCLHSDVDPTRYNIKKNRRLANKFGSSADINLNWKVAYNINYSSRLFIFSDYEYFQGDWQHTIDCRINRYLTTSIYANMRYDTRTPRCDDDPKWHKFQFKEILSFGIAYHFGTI